MLLLQVSGLLGGLAGAGLAASPLGWIGAGVGALGTIGKFLLGNKQNKLADQINPQYNVYTGSPEAKQQLGAVENAYNGRMAGAATAQDRLLQSQSNNFANASRGATDASQLLALGASGQGATDTGLVNLATAEGQNKQSLLGNLQNAYNTMTSDERFANQSQLEKYKEDMAAKAGLRQAGIGNQYGAANDLSSMIMQMGQIQGINKQAKKAGGLFGSLIG